MDTTEIEGTPQEAVDLAYELYQALDKIMWRENQLPRGESKPARKAMAAYEAWEAKRNDNWQRRYGTSITDERPQVRR